MNTQQNPNQEMNSLQDVREQYNALKNTIDQQCVVTQKFITTAMKNHLSTIRRTLVGNLGIMIAGIVAISFWPFIFDISTAFVAATILYFAIAGAAEVYLLRVSRPRNILYSNTVEATKTLLFVKRFMQLWVICSSPVALGWIVWMLFEFQTLSTGLFASACTGASVGGVVGLCIGIQRYRSIMRELNYLIEALASLKETEAQSSTIA